MDRNQQDMSSVTLHYVALRKESVDRNISIDVLPQLLLLSLSARRAWIEIYTPRSAGPWQAVALRKESVDRNAGKAPYMENAVGRSPQGERG